MVTWECQSCGKEFEAIGRGRYRYCEEHRLSRAAARARDQRNLRTRRREARSPATCRVCGKHFVGMRSDANKCSDECKRLDLNRRARESEKRHRGLCLDCGVSIARRSLRCGPCSQKPRIQKITGPNNYAWKGGRSIDGYGYVHLLVAPKARKGHRYQPEHRLVWQAANGPIPDGYVIHHINGIKDDNRLENLEALPRKKHNHRHDDHDRRIRELEAENARLRRLLNA